jgi:hypothetical protein
MKAGIRTKRKAPSEKLYDGHVHAFIAGHREGNTDEMERVYEYIKCVYERLCRTRFSGPQNMWHEKFSSQTLEL